MGGVSARWSPRPLSSITLRGSDAVDVNYSLCFIIACSCFGDVLEFF